MDLTRGIQNDIPIIICTGHSSLIDEEKAKDIGISAFIMKLITTSEIAKHNRNVLNENKDTDNRSGSEKIQPHS